MFRTTPTAFAPEQPATAADALLRALEADGVEVVFGLPGGAALPLYDALARGTTLRHVLARHEQGAGHMAQGYARASGKVGVVFATSGPGATNLVTPIADAWSDSTPLVCITGQVATPAIGTRAFQETDIVSVVRPITKAAWQVHDPRRLASTVRDALRLARTGRHGPVLVDVPKDVQSFVAPLRELLAALAEEPAPPPWRPLDARAVERAARLLAEAKRPVLVVGGGAVAACAAAAGLALAEPAGAPVGTTM
jgi:acetolactate synthase-1/2/3 large subunit